MREKRESERKRESKRWEGRYLQRSCDSMCMFTFSLEWPSESQCRSAHNVFIHPSHLHISIARYLCLSMSVYVSIIGEHAIGWYIHHMCIFSLSLCKVSSDLMEVYAGDHTVCLYIHHHRIWPTCKCTNAGRL